MVTKKKGHRTLSHWFRRIFLVLLGLGNPQTLEIVVDVLTSDAVKIGVGAVARLERWRAERVLKVPSSAVFRCGQGWAAFAIRGGHVRLAPIEVGHRSGLEVEITRGLGEGEQDDRALGNARRAHTLNAATANSSRSGCCKLYSLDTHSSLGQPAVRRFWAHRLTGNIMSRLRRFAWLASVALPAACSVTEGHWVDRDAGAQHVGGQASVGGISSKTGGGPSIGGNTSAGGTSAATGSSSTGGSATSVGGTQAVGGAGGTSGALVTGGTASGTLTSTGAGSSAGGTTSTGGPSATGGTATTGVAASTGSNQTTGGTTSTVGTGGIVSTGGAATGGAPAYCTIDSVRYSSGDYNLDNHCLICQPSETTTEWVFAAEGASCDPGKICHDHTCQAGCIVGGTYYADGTKNSNDSCQSCQSTTSTSVWTPLASVEGTTCGTGQVCHSGTCQAGCWIESTYYAAGTNNSKGPCPITCQPTLSTTTWTLDGASCGCTGSLETVQTSTGLCVAKTAPITGPASDAGNTDYSIDVTEVTKGQYDLWLGTQPALPASTDANCGYVMSYAEQSTSEVYTGTDAAHHPVVYVDWCDAYAYCKGVGKRLCGAIGGGSNAYASYADATLSQWHRACNSGGTNTYPYGNTYQASTCNGADYSSGTDQTVAVGSLTSCVTSVVGYAGVYDLSGNVWEWEDSCNGTCHVRGHSFYGAGSNLACGYGYDHYPRNLVSSDVGFRCCSP